MARYCPSGSLICHSPGKLQRCASCNELKKSCFDYELSETDTFFLKDRPLIDVDRQNCRRVAKERAADAADSDSDSFI